MGVCYMFGVAGLVGFLNAVEKHAWSCGLDSISKVSDYDGGSESFEPLVQAIAENMTKAKAFDIGNNITAQESIVLWRF